MQPTARQARLEIVLDALRRSAGGEEPVRDAIFEWDKRFCLRDTCRLHLASLFTPEGRAILYKVRDGWNGPSFLADVAALLREEVGFPGRAAELVAPYMLCEYIEWAHAVERAHPPCPHREDGTCPLHTSILGEPKARSKIRETLSEYAEWYYLVEVQGRHTAAIDAHAQAYVRQQDEIRRAGGAADILGHVEQQLAAYDPNAIHWNDPRLFFDNAADYYRSIGQLAPPQPPTWPRYPWDRVVDIAREKAHPKSNHRSDEFSRACGCEVWVSTRIRYVKDLLGLSSGNS